MPAHRKELTKEQTERICKLRKNGTPIKNIAKTIGISRDKLSIFFRKNNIKPERSTYEGFWNKEKEDRLIQFFIEGRSHEEFEIEFATSFKSCSNRASMLRAKGYFIPYLTKSKSKCKSN